MITLPHKNGVPETVEPDFMNCQMRIDGEDSFIADKIWIIEDGPKYVMWHQTPDKSSAYPKRKGGLVRFDKVSIIPAI